MTELQDLVPSEIIRTVYHRLMDGTGRATERGSCAYRTTDGHACAVGCLLTDAEAQAIIDDDRNGQGVHVLTNAKLLPRRLEPHYGLLSDLQAVHDRPYHWDGSHLNEAGMGRLRHVASNYGVSIDHPSMQPSPAGTVDA